MKINVKDAAIKLQYSEETIRRMIRTGELKAEMNSRKEGYLIDISHLDDIINIRKPYLNINSANHKYDDVEKDTLRMEIKYSELRIKYLKELLALMEEV